MDSDLRDFIQYLLDNGYSIELIGFQDEETGVSKVYQINPVEDN